MSKSKSLSIVVAVAMAALVFTTIVGSPALAVKPEHAGNDKGKGGGNGGTHATLTVSPNPVPAGGAIFSGSGSGYFPSSFAYVNIRTPRTLYATSVATDASGNVHFEHATAEEGTYTVEVFQYKRKKLVLMATADLVVTQP